MYCKVLSRQCKHFAKCYYQLCYHVKIGFDCNCHDQNLIKNVDLNSVSKTCCMYNTDMSSGFACLVQFLQQPVMKQSRLLAYCCVQSTESLHLSAIIMPSFGCNQKQLNAMQTREQVSRVRGTEKRGGPYPLRGWVPGFAVL